MSIADCRTCSPGSRGQRQTSSVSRNSNQQDLTSPRLLSVKPDTMPSGADRRPGTESPSLRAEPSQCSRGPSSPATRRTSKAGHRSSWAWHSDWLHLSPERQSTTRPQIRLQACLVRAANRTCCRAQGGQYPGCACGRLQCRAHRRGHLSDQVVVAGCAASARIQSGVSTPAQPRLDRRNPGRPPVRAHLHVLGLQAGPLASGRRSPDRPPVTVFRSSSPPARRWRGPRGSWRTNRMASSVRRAPSARRTAPRDRMMAVCSAECRVRLPEPSRAGQIYPFFCKTLCRRT